MVKINLLYFSNKACGVCVVLYPKLEELIRFEYPFASIEYIDATANQELCGTHSVFTVPTLLLFEDGKETMRWCRHFSLDQIAQKLDRIKTLAFTD